MLLNFCKTAVVAGLCQALLRIEGRGICVKNHAAGRREHEG